MSSSSASKTGRKRRLGRGLESLITSPVAVDTPAGESNVPAVPLEPVGDGGTGNTIEEADMRITALPLEHIVPNRSQPRRDFPEETLAELADSIKVAGVMQPILVRPTSQHDVFELIAGERRWRAAGLVPLLTIPAIIQEVDDRTAAEWALIENVQREDLNPIDRAEAFAVLIDSHELSHQDLADRLGISRSAVTNTLRMNDLDDRLKAMVRQGDLSVGHAKVLLGIEDSRRRAELALKAAQKSWSVRGLEESIRAAAQLALPPQSRALTAATESTKNPHLRDLETRLGEHLGTRVLILEGRKKGTGKVIIEFYSLDEFDALLDRVGYNAAD